VLSPERATRSAVSSPLALNPALRTEALAVCGRIVAAASEASDTMPSLRPSRKGM